MHEHSRTRRFTKWHHVALSMLVKEAMPGHRSACWPRIIYTGSCLTRSLTWFWPVPFRIPQVSGTALGLAQWPAQLQATCSSMFSRSLGVWRREVLYQWPQGQRTISAYSYGCTFRYQTEKRQKMSSAPKSHNHRMAEVGRDVWRSSSTTPPFLCNEHIAQEGIQVGIEYLQSRRHHYLSGHLSSK